MTANGVSRTHAVPLLAAGASTVIKVPANQAPVKTNGSLTFATQLVNPRGITDRVSANNRKTSILTPVAK